MIKGQIKESSVKVDLSHLLTYVKKLKITVAKQIVKFESVQPKKDDGENSEEIEDENRAPLQKLPTESLYCEQWEIDIQNASEKCIVYRPGDPIVETYEYT